MTNYTLLLWFFFLPFLAKGQVLMKVVSAQSNEPLPGANIVDLQSDALYVTNTDGVADLPEAGKIYLISYVGFDSKKAKANAGEMVVSLEPNYQFLNEVEVRGHENNTDYLSVAGSYNYLNQEELTNYGQESLVRSVNTLPGVRMEERSPASYRLSIRGSLLRAPFGVRNVKVYWNEIPFTDPTGNGYLYFLDNDNIDRIEIIKGPAGSVYGAGMGGVLLLGSAGHEKLGLHGSAGLSAGSFGLKTMDLGVHYGGDKVNSSIRYSGLKQEGYREHTETDRNVFQWKSVIKNSEKNQFSAHILYSDLLYELPGGLTRDQYEEDPRQARQVSVDQNAYVDHENVLIGISNAHQWDEKWNNTTSLYFSNGTKENPFITNYELERLRGLGGRTKFVRKGELWGNEFFQTAGMEVQYGKFHANNHDNDAGYAGDLRYEDLSKIYQGFIFAQAEYFIQRQWILTLGASLNYLRFDINRLRDVELDSSYSFTREFDPVVSPRLGVVRKINANSSLHASISEGFSPPSQDEIRTSDGEINRDLEAERGINYEIGYRGNTSDGIFMFDITAFYMQQKRTIVSRTSEAGVSKFENAGSTSQRGLEALLAVRLIDNPSALFSRAKLQAAITYHDFEFKNYVKTSGDTNADFSGNDLTGTAPFIAVTTLDMEFSFGGYVFLSHNFTDRIPLNDANTVYASGYHLVTGKMGWKYEGKNSVEIYAGIDNLLDKKYSLGNDLNAFGERYFEPSPPRNYYFGVNVSF